MHLGHEISKNDKGNIEDLNGNKFENFDQIFVCNGSASSLMSKVGLKSKSIEYTCGVLWFCGKSTAIRNHLFQVTKGTQKLAGLLPTGNGECSFFWGATKQESEIIKSDLDKWKREVMKIIPEATEILSHITDSGQLIYTNWRHRKVNGITKDKTVFMGDAAFSSSPHLGQGVNLGLLDAWIYNQVLKDDFESTVLEYSRNRIPHRKFYATLSALLSPLFQSPYRGTGNLRDIGLPILSSVPIFRKQMISVLSGLRSGWFGNEIKLN